MKITKHLFLAAVIAGSLFAMTLQAQPAAGDEKKGGKKAEAAQRGAKLAEELGLSAEQKEKIKPILQAEREKVQALKDLSPEQRREKMQAIRKETGEKVKPILTAEQLEKWKKLREQHGQRKAKQQ